MGLGDFQMLWQLDISILKGCATGKTVQMIATMAMNMPDVNDTIRATLIVVPAALLQQVRLFFELLYVYSYSI